MRNTTKLKAVLLRYSVYLEMTDDGILALTLVDKIHLGEVRFESTSYSTLITKSYSYLLKTLRESDGRMK